MYKCRQERGRGQFEMAVLTDKLSLLENVTNMRIVMHSTPILETQGLWPDIK